MPHLKILAPLVIATILAACGEEKTVTAKGPSEVTAIQVKVQETPVTFEYTAQTESSQLVDIRTRVSGFLDKRVYKEGSLVRSGQTLFNLRRQKESYQPSRHVFPLRRQRWPVSNRWLSRMLYPRRISMIQSATSKLPRPPSRLLAPMS